MEEVARLRQQLPSTKPRRPYAFIFGHGLWNDLDLQATLNWLDLILDTAASAAPWLSTPYQKVPDRSGEGDKRKSSGRTRESRKLKISKLHTHSKDRPFWPRLFLTPNAAGKGKPDEWIVSQGNKALMLFEEAIRHEVHKRDVEHLGTWNMSIQASKYDGV